MPSPTTHFPSAIILAAGYSSRMGRFKPLLELGGRAAIEGVISLYQSVGVTDIHVVTGFRSATIQKAVRTSAVRLVHNPDHDAGMFSSVLAGVKALPTGVGTFFVHPVDIPLVRPHTLTLIMQAGRVHAPAIAYPVFDGRRGHPPLIRCDLRQAIQFHDGRGGLRAVLDRFDDAAMDVPVADNGVVLDMDTPMDYAQLSHRSKARAILNDDECRVLMETVCRLPDPIIGHCRQVATVAERLAHTVNKAGGNLDVARVRSAALVHDLGRLEKNHAAAGADLLARMGFPDLAAIVAVHMQIDRDDHGPIDEAQVVHLADKLVLGRAIVDLETRFTAKLQKYGRNPETARGIADRRQAALAIQAKIERMSGSSIDEILRSGP